MDDARERDVRARRRARRVTKRAERRAGVRTDRDARERAVGSLGLDPARTPNARGAREEGASSPSDADARGEGCETMEEKKKR